jgi:hypothetical protein
MIKEEIIDEHVNKLEMSGRTIFINFLQKKLQDKKITDYKIKEAVKRFSAWDVSLNLNKICYVFELKCRTFPALTYKSNMLQFNKFTKLQELKNKYKNKDIRLYYVNIFTDNKLTIQHIDDYYNVQQITARKNNVENKREVKDVIYIDIKKSDIRVNV